MKKPYETVPVRSSEITPEHIYINRRQFLKGLAAVGAGSLLAACAPDIAKTLTPGEQATGAPEAPNPSGLTDELGNAANSYEQISQYNNFYEFTIDKEGVARLAEGYATSPWTIEFSGLVNKPQTLSFDDLVSRFDQEERIYRLRCVEGWSMVIPWLGFPLSKLLSLVEPMGSAKYVKFTTILDQDHMPGQNTSYYPWPYIEGLRMDEAMNDLSFVVTGLYGKPLPPQNGAPLRIAVPWKYGFKSGKSIVKVELTEEEPYTFWNTIAPHEYGFYANVNPQVDHPRWSQASERRIGELSRRSTLMFNGYADQVASMYSDMDLTVYY
ncbi:MAG: protein-methionine-sulfoxide reductase catalytic subunit MsrP [Anaerolineae bacterium]|nr:protein-methionine-sulfoxide reductase catalytic subunit MsrP [Anaerolineae bacterium]